jgi:hypothetical protein
MCCVCSQLAVDPPNSPHISSSPNSQVLCEWVHRGPDPLCFTFIAFHPIKRVPAWHMHMDSYAGVVTMALRGRSAMPENLSMPPDLATLVFQLIPTFSCRRRLFRILLVGHQIAFFSLCAPTFKLVDPRGRRIARVHDHRVACQWRLKTRRPSSKDPEFLPNPQDSTITPVPVPEH